MNASITQAIVSHPHYLALFFTVTHSFFLIRRKMPPKKRRKLRMKLPNPQNSTTVLQARQARPRWIMSRKQGRTPSRRRARSRVTWTRSRGRRTWARRVSTPQRCARFFRVSLDSINRQCQLYNFCGRVRQVHQRRLLAMGIPNECALVVRQKGDMGLRHSNRPQQFVVTALFFINLFFWEAFSTLHNYTPHIQQNFRF